MLGLDKALGITRLDDEKIGVFDQESKLLDIGDRQIFFQPYLRIEVAETLRCQQQVRLKLLSLNVCLRPFGKEVPTLRFYRRYGSDRRCLGTLLLFKGVGR
jgi:hypothetical protein